MKNKKRITGMLLSLLCFAVITPYSYAGSSAREIRKGNRLYKEKKYSEAIKIFRQAGKKDPDSDIALFNLGAALYKKGKYREAIDAFSRALDTDDRDLEAKAIYNLANTKYKLGNAQAKKDINGAIGLYRESLDYYRRAMEMNEKDRDAKYNHELVEKQLKVLLDRLKKQPPRKQSDKRKDQGEKDRKQASRDKQKHRKHGENKQSKQKKQQQPGTKKKQAGAEQGKRKATSGKKGKKAQLQTGKQEKKEMTPEEARMLLNAFGKQKSIGKLLQHKGGYFPQVVKDW